MVSCNSHRRIRITFMTINQIYCQSCSQCYRSISTLTNTKREKSDAQVNLEFTRVSSELCYHTKRQLSVFLFRLNPQIKLKSLSHIKRTLNYSQTLSTLSCAQCIHIIILHFQLIHTYDIIYIYIYFFLQFSLLFCIRVKRVNLCSDITVIHAILIIISTVKILVPFLYRHNSISIKFLSLCSTNFYY